MRTKVFDAAVRLVAVSTATLALLAFQPAYAEAGIDTSGDGQQTPAQLPGSGDRPVNDLTRGGTKTGGGTKAGTKTAPTTATGGNNTPTGTGTTHDTGTNNTGPTTATGGANTATGTATEGDTVGEEAAGGQQQTTVGGVETGPATGETGQQVGGDQSASGQAGQVAGQQSGPGQMGQPAGMPLGLNQLPSTATSAAGELIAIIGTGAAALYAALRSRR